MACEVVSDDFPAQPGRSAASRLLASQAFWVTISVFLIPIALTVIEPTFRDAYWKSENYFNILRNFSLIAIIALGQVAVIITGRNLILPPSITAVWRSMPASRRARM